MCHHNTGFSQFLKLVPRHEFERLANAHHSGRSLRAISRWDQFVALMMGQLAGRQSLRDVIANLDGGNPLIHKGFTLSADHVRTPAIGSLGAAEYGGTPDSPVIRTSS